MLPKLFKIFVLIVVVKSIDGKAVENNNDAAQYSSSYYNLQTGIALKGEIDRENYQVDDGRLHLSPMRIAFRGIPCECEKYSCECCAGVNISAFNLNRRACTNFTYDPKEIAIKVKVMINDNEIFSNKISATNPPPLCMPFPYFPAVNFCVRFFNISLRENHLRTCIDFETRVVSSSILVLHFNCVRVGTDGIQWQKPEEALLMQENSQVQILHEYDEVLFEAEDLDVGSNFTSTQLTEEEQQVGQLKA